jgi:hypothetical protein
MTSRRGGLVVAAALLLGGRAIVACGGDSTSSPPAPLEDAAAPADAALVGEAGSAVDAAARAAPDASIPDAAAPDEDAAYPAESDAAEAAVGLTCGPGTHVDLDAGECLSDPDAAYYDLRVPVSTLGADGYSSVPVLALGRLADGSAATDAVIFSVSPANAGTLLPAAETLTSLGAGPSFVPCNGTTTPSCLGEATLSMALASAPGVPVAQTGLVLVAPTGIGSDAQCLGGGNVLYFDGDVADYIHPGIERLTGGVFSLSPTPSPATQASTVQVSYVNGTTNYIVELSSLHLGQFLAPDVYTGAERAAFAGAGHPGMDIFGDGRGCNTVSGSFQVEDVTFSGTTLTSFTATFEQHCEGATAALRGCVHVGP